MSDKQENYKNNSKDKREAANRLMDGITDLSDEIILAADRVGEGGSGDSRPVNPKSQKDPTSSGKNKRIWILVGTTAAAVLLAVLVALGANLGRKTKEDGLTTEPYTGLTVTEEGVTEAGVTEAVVTVVTQGKATEAGATEAGATEAGATEAVATDAATTEAGTERRPTEAAAKENAVHVMETGNIPGEEVKTVSFASLAEMEEYADVILRAERLDREEPHIERTVDAISSSAGVFTGGWTFSEVRIRSVYKDTTDQMKEGNSITILENEVYDDMANVVYHINGYEMMVAGNEYLLFLKKCVLEDGTEYYVSCGVNYGTISTAEDGRYKNRRYRNKDESIDLSVYEKIWEEALKKYLYGNGR